MNASQNPVSWFEIYVNDMARAKAFYEATFAVQLQPLPSPDPSLEMWMFPMTDGCAQAPGAPGALCKMEGCSAGPGGTLVYFECDDCAIEEARALQAGGSLIKSKFPIGQYGFISLVRDTEGNMIGLHSLK